MALEGHQLFQTGTGGRSFCAIVNHSVDFAVWTWILDIRKTGSGDSDVGRVGVA